MIERHSLLKEIKEKVADLGIGLMSRYDPIVHITNSMAMIQVTVEMHIYGGEQSSRY